MTRRDVKFDDMEYRKVASMKREYMKLASC